METKEILEGNKMIAEFMSLEFIGGKFASFDPEKQTFGGSTIKDLKYNSSWDWIMPVLEKIESLNYRASITEFCTNIGNEKLKISQWQGITKKENTYKAVIEFINWYNSQPKN
jgi:hypothetical protein